MTIEIFLMLLTIFSTITSLFTEGVKKFLDSAGINYAANIIVLIGAALAGGIGTSAYYFINNVEWNAQNIFFIVIMIVANWLGATVGYDKITQAIQQIKK